MCRRHGVAASLPYFLPAPPFFLLGTFGAFIRVRSRFPDRRALFDMGAAGPWAGLRRRARRDGGRALRLSTVDATPPDGPTRRCSATRCSPASSHASSCTPSPTRSMLHPVAFAAWAGLLVTSLNLLPAGQLDGGHVLYAARGRRRSRCSRPCCSRCWSGSASRGRPFWLVWAVVAAAHAASSATRRTVDDALPLGPRPRRLGAVASLILFVVTFVPEPIRIRVHERLARPGTSTS